MGIKGYVMVYMGIKKSTSGKLKNWKSGKMEKCNIRKVGFWKSAKVEK